MTANVLSHLGFGDVVGALRSRLALSDLRCIRCGRSAGMERGPGLRTSEDQEAPKGPGNFQSASADQCNPEPKGVKSKSRVREDAGTTLETVSLEHFIIPHRFLSMRT